MADMNDMIRWMMNPMAQFMQKGVAVSESYQHLLKAQADMLSAMATYSQASASLYRVLLEQGGDMFKSELNPLPPPSRGKK